jgi:hypothetical protein
MHFRAERRMSMMNWGCSPDSNCGVDMTTNWLGDELQVGRNKKRVSSHEDLAIPLQVIAIAVVDA